jgi:hypothetical protein
MQGILVFASAAARDAAITSPEEGQFAFLKDTNVTTYYTGSAWANVDTTGMTNPMTTTGDTIYSSSGSTPARLGVGSTGQVLTVAGGVPTWATPASGTPTFVGCMLRKTADQNVLTSTYTAITFDSEVLDTDAFHDNSTNTERITIPSGKGGKYLITATIHYAANANFTRRNLVTLNGAVGSGTTICDQRTGGFSAAPSEATFVGFYSLSAGDYIQLNAFQDSGTTVAALGFSTAYTYFGVQYLGA